MKILTFPKFRQTYDYDCGAQVLESIFAYYGKDIREEKIMKYAKTDSDHGTRVSMMLKTIKKYKFKSVAKKMQIKDLKYYIDKKIPIILLVQAWAGRKKVKWRKDWKDGHYVVAIGYDNKKIYFADPSSIFVTYLTYKELMNRWHDKETIPTKKRFVNFGIAVYGKKPVFDFKKKIHMN